MQTLLFFPPQEQFIKVLELISTIWDSDLHVAGLRLLNNLPLPDFVHPQLRRVMPALMEILQSDYILAQVPQDHVPGPTLLTSPGTASRGRRPRLTCFLMLYYFLYLGTSHTTAELPGTEE